MSETRARSSRHRNKEVQIAKLDCMEDNEQIMAANEVWIKEEPMSEGSSCGKEMKERGGVEKEIPCEVGKKSSIKKNKFQGLFIPSGGEPFVVMCAKRMKPIMNKKEGNQTITYDVYVGNVPKNINEIDLKHLFSKYGEVKQVLCRWKEDYFGYGIIKFSYKKDADRILREVQEVTLNGHTMPVKTARRSEHSTQNGSSNFENKPNVYSDMNKNQICSGSNFSNTEKYVADYRHSFKPKVVYLHSKVYAALFSEDNSWYRCSVVKISLPNKPGMCCVRYIDFGNREEISYQNIIEIPESLQKVPPMASKFILSNLVCDTKATNKRSCLHQLVNKRMTLSARLSHNMEYHVFWCSCNGKDVISDIISKGFAKPVRLESCNQELNTKSRAYACGSENRASSNYNSCASSLYIPKALEPPVNGAANNNKKTQKNQCKSKEGSPRSEEVYCNGIAEEVRKDNEFHPKMIIKRGSELGDIVRKSSLEASPKEKNSSQPSAYMLDSVHPNLKFINNIRSLVSQSSDDSIISSAVELLKNEITTIVHSEVSIKSVISASQKYWESVENLKRFVNEKRREICTNMGLPSSFEERLTCLKSARDSFRVDLFNKLEDYLGSCDIKEERWNLVSKTRAKTDQAHQQFDDILSTIKKEFHLNTLEENEVSNFNSNVYNIGKTTSFDDQLKKALTIFGNALEEEIQTLTVNKDSGNYSVIQCLLDILDVHKEKIDSLCDHYENYYAVYNDLNKLPDIKKTLDELKGTSKEVHTLTEELCHKEDSYGNDAQQEMLALRQQIHRPLLKEDLLIGVLAKAAESHFPELFIEVPELNLQNYLENKLLLKNWRPDYFLNFGAGQRGEFSYESYINDEPITIKEYSFENVEECNAFIRKAVQWNEVRSDHIVKIKALFFKNENTICAILPPITSTLLKNVPPTSPCDGEKACRILRQVLIGLKDIHSAGFVHHAVHPTTIVIENEKALIDFCFDSKYVDERVNFKGINFLPPEIKAAHESADMYGFGCLVLWVLFPNLSFTLTEDGVPNITAFKSIIQELILPKDYSFLSSLIDANPERRPSSCTLLSKGTDNGLEFVNEQLDTYLANSGIFHEKTIPYNSESNGKAERARSLLYESELPLKFWAEAINVAPSVLM
ncbi:Serine/threonine-protein kinase 31 like protein [Argiope bruennichi]|uniref:Serine/threonine-protein kinase 31 like protein n=1 Tax=Argiope bruennichi TaxID=94029 RepID=A0A8T0ET47_ARGBR|nr:Serine/threonine-protein kinase 31 like protein [Argiope bruennichi]